MLGAAQGAGHSELSGVEVHVVPEEAEDLAPAEPDGHGEGDHRADAFSFDRFEEPPRVLGGEDVRVCTFDTGGFHEGGRVPGDVPPPFRLVEGTAQDGADVPPCCGGEPFGFERAEEALYVLGGELGERDPADVRDEVQPTQSGETFLVCDFPSGQTPQRVKISGPDDPSPTLVELAR